LNFLDGLFGKSLNIDAHENPSSGSRVVLIGPADMSKVKESLFAILLTRLKQNKNFDSVLLEIDKGWQPLGRLHIRPDLHLNTSALVVSAVEAVSRSCNVTPQPNNTLRCRLQLQVRLHAPLLHVWVARSGPISGVHFAVTPLITSFNPIYKLPSFSSAPFTDSQILRKNIVAELALQPNRRICFSCRYAFQLLFHNLWHYWW